MQPITNSKLSKLRLKLEGKEMNMKIMGKYLRFGSLVDALITEPERVDLNKLSLHNKTRYEDEHYLFKPWEIELAQEMKEAFFANSFCRKVMRHAEKAIFQKKMQIENFEIDVEGEADLLWPSQNLNTDIKVTACTSQKEFVKKCKELFYDQQGSFYMDNFQVDRHVVIGISRKVRDANNLPKLFFFPIERTNDLYKVGKEKYVFWTKKYLSEHNLWDEVRVLDAA